MALIGSLSAQTFTNPVGAVKITLKGKSDTIVSVPLTPSPDYSGKIASTAPGATNRYALTISGTPAWTTNQFANLYFVRMTSGARQGMYYTITANTSGQLTVDTAGDNLAGIVANDTFKIYRYWTLGSLFPPASAGTPTNPLTASSGLAAFQRQSQILLPDNSSPGTNLSPNASYFFTASGGWVQIATGNPVATDTILWPDSYFIVRQPAAITADASWTVVGSVPLTKLTTPLSTQAAASQDNYVGLTRPTDIRLADAGLETGFVDSLGLASFQRRDVLYTYDNSTAGFNKSATKAFFRYGGNWYAVSTGNPLANDEVLAAGSGFIIRKYQAANGALAFWSNTPAY